MVNQINPKPTNAHVQQASKKLEIGWMGIIFGDATEKPGNIAAAAIIMAFIGIVVIAVWMPDSATSPKGELLTLFGTVITGAIGFVFGRSTS